MMFQTRWLAASAAILASLSFAMPQLEALSQTSAQLYFESLLQINQDSDLEPFMVADERVIDRLNRSGFRVYSGAYLIGTFYMENLTADTLLIAPPSQPLMQFLTLKYSYRDDSAKAAFSIPFNYVELVKTYPDTILPARGNGNTLPPHASLQVDASCSWDELSKLRPTITEFHWEFDNTRAMQSDTNITLAQYESRIRAFKIVPIPQDRPDSIYYYNLLAKRELATGNLEDALAYCQMILQLDSTDFKAIERITDTLWKMRRYSDAELYAQKGIAVLDAYLSGIVNPLGKSEANQYLNILRERLQKIRMHEEWRAVSGIGQ